MRKLILVFGIFILLQILGFSIPAEAQATEILVDQNFTGPFDSSLPISEFDLDREVTRQLFIPSAGNLKAVEIFVANRFEPLSHRLWCVVLYQNHLRQKLCLHQQVKHLTKFE